MLGKAILKCQRIGEYLEKQEIIQNEININEYENNIEIPKLNQIFSKIKTKLIYEGYLDYKNKPYYNILEDNMHIDFKNTLFVNLDNIFEDDFIKSFTGNLINLENNNFFLYLKKLCENPLYLFHINYDFLNKLEVNNNIDSYLFYQSINNITNNTIIDEIDIKNIIEDEKFSISKQLSNLKSMYNDSYELNKNLNIKIDRFIGDVNNYKVLLKDIDKNLIMEDNQKEFLKKLELNISDLEITINNYKYEHKIQDYIDKKYCITNKINEFELTKIENNKHILFYENENIKNQKEGYFEKENDIQIRELKNKYIKNINKISIENEVDYNKKYYDEIKIKTTLLKSEIKKINQDIKDLENKINDIENKEIKTKSKNEKKNEILRKRFQKIKNSYLREIKSLEEEKNKKEKYLENKINTLNDNIFVDTKNVNEKDEIKELINQITKKQVKRKNMIDAGIKENYKYIEEYKKKVLEIQKNIINENQKLDVLNNKYFEIYKIYDEYNNRLINLNKVKDIIIEINKLKDKLSINKKIIINEFLNFIKKYNTPEKINSNDYLGKLKDSFINVNRLRDIVNICDIELSNELFNINTLHLIDKNRERYFMINKRDYNNKDIDNYNINNLKILINLYNHQEIDSISKDLKKMIYILK